MNINPCPECNGEINRDFRVQQIWRNASRWTIGIAYCDFCGNVIPFRSDGISIEEFDNDAKTAWNSQNKKEGD